MNANRPHEAIDRSVVDAPIPTAREIKELKSRANRDKEHSSGGDHLPVTQVRQAVTVGTMRYVWAVSLVLAVLAMILAYGLAIH